MLVYAVFIVQLIVCNCVLYVVILEVKATVCMLVLVCEQIFNEQSF